MKRGTDLLAEIERGALDSSVPLADTLRKCIVLGGKSGSERLRDWATRELKGYEPDDDLPEYRIVQAPIRLDAIVNSGGTTFKTSGQGISPRNLEHYVGEGKVTEELHLNQGVGGIEEMVRSPGDRIRVGLPHASDLVLLMNHDNNNPSQHIEMVYWEPAPQAIRACLDQIRTSLTQLVAELQASGASGSPVSSAAADNAVSVIVSGKRNNVTVNNAQSSGEDSIATAAPSANEARGFWTRTRQVIAAVAGLVTIGGAALALLHPL